jgi:GrpB-like predicted nucleotidyltransferase (UPF0157 family)
MLREDLFRTLGRRAKRIAHIGSTAVPGLGAKDIIDIQIGVDNLSRDVVSRLVAAGHEFVAKHGNDHVPQGDANSPEGWVKLHFRGPSRIRPCHVRVRVRGNPVARPK